MARVASKNTAAELRVRRAFHAAGLRYRLHIRRLPGTPDLALRKFNLAVFVNGCFWHQHPGCRRATRPEANREFWERKLANNATRDALNLSKLHQLGWTVLTIWECETDLNTLTRLAADVKAEKLMPRDQNAGTLPLVAVGGH
jgi:DNA mismatch endonuclease (patch repair protein)